MDLLLNDEQLLIKDFAELGWLAIPFSEEDGGPGGVIENED